MIDRVEFYQSPNGIAITFYYDTDCMDTFSVHEPSQVSHIMELVSQEPEPELVLIALRDFGRFSLH